LETPTAIARDLLHINKKPCILFIHWSINHECILREAEDLCLQTRALQTVESFVQFLESSGVPGDAVASQGFSTWYKAKFGELKAMSPQQYLFDPSLLVVGLIKDLATTLAQVNKLEVTRKNVLVPLCFVRCWAADFTDRVKRDELLLVKLACA
jgi:hypothetical protein